MSTVQQVSPTSNSTTPPPPPEIAALPPITSAGDAAAPAGATAPAAAPPPTTASAPPPEPAPPLTPGSNSTAPPPSSPSPSSPPSPPPPSSPSPSSPPSPPSPSSPSPSSPPSPPSPNSISPPSNSTSKPSPPPPPPPSTSTKSPPPPSSSGSSPLPSPSPSPSGSSSLSTTAIVGIAVGGIAVIVMVILLLACCRKKRRRNPEEEAFYGSPIPPPKADTHGGRHQQWQQTLATIPDGHVALHPNPSPSPEFSSQTYNITSSGESHANIGANSPIPFSKNTFSYEELARATNGFSDANLLGQGGFGYVHKGTLPNGKEIAVKQLKAGSGQGEREFQAEVEIISRVHHKHLVSLVGYCSTGTQRLLVYEYVPNNTLEFHLHGKGTPTMGWPTRLRIALGAAKGIAYLHEDCHPKIIHRDIKASNILLDSKYEAKVADFGLAKFSSDANTHVSTRVMGTFGYLAPEYAASGKLTEKSDVFSYGVMLLELITGRRPVDTTNTYMEDSLVDWARPLLVRALEEGNYDNLGDPKLENNFDENEMARIVACAAACVRHSAKRRPKMSLVVRALEGEMTLTDLNEGIKPGHSRVYGSYGSSDYDSTQYRDDMKIFRRLALGSQEMGSREVSNQFGLYPSGSSSESQPQ